MISGTRVRGNCGQRMPWYSSYLMLFWVFLIFITSWSVVEAVNRVSLHWNNSNPFFNSGVLNIPVFSEVDFKCPSYFSTANSHQWEYYLVYLVPKDYYDDCRLKDDSKIDLILNCSTPFNTTEHFTVIVTTFQPNPYLPDFYPGHKYYFISTSTGTQSGLNNAVQGACLHQGMKMQMAVHNASTTTVSTQSTRPHSQQTSSTSSSTKQTTKTTTTTTSTTTKTTTTTTTSPTTTTTVSGGSSVVIQVPDDGHKNTGVIDVRGCARTLNFSWHLLCICLLIVTMVRTKVR